MENKTKVRNSNIELLRVFAMILIILHHYALHGGLIEIERAGINKAIGAIILIGGKIGVNLFVLITGYFLIESKLKVKKILKLIGQVLFYTVSFFIIGTIINGNYSFEEIKKSFLPITFNTYWFITAYIGIYVLSPFINKFVKSIKQEKLMVLIVILLILFSLIGFVSSSSGYMGNLQWFLLMYIVGAYIRLYDFEFITKKKIKLFSVIGYCILIIGAIISVFISQYSGIFFKLFRKAINMNSIVIFIESVLLFLTFKNLEIKANNVINVFGKYSFGVYLFHDNFIFKSFLWKNILKIENFYFANPYFLILHILGCTIGIYLVGTLIELIRVKIIEEPIFKIKKFDKWFEKIDNFINCD